MAESLLFTSSDSSNLAQNIIAAVPSLRQGKYRLGHFIDGEVMFYLDEPVRDKLCFVFGHTGPPADNLLSMFTIVNTLKLNGAKSIISVIPYLGYARSDRDKPLQPINSQLFAGFLKQAGASQIICLDLHSELNKKFFTIPLTHLSALPLMADIYQSLNIPNLTIATPDLGGSDRAKLFAKAMGIKNIVVIEKYRPSVQSAVPLKITGNVNNKNVILVDDMIQTGGTLLAAAKLLRSKGAKNLYVAVTHCVYQSKGINLLTSTSLFKKILITNSLKPQEKLPSKVSVIDISHLLSTAIARITSSSVT
ncbi:MAG: ribose-phosphate diphosphokinase [Microgenomates group bacterium]